MSQKYCGQYASDGTSRAWSGGGGSALHVQHSTVLSNSTSSPPKDKPMLAVSTPSVAPRTIPKVMVGQRRGLRRVVRALS